MPKLSMPIPCRAASCSPSVIVVYSAATLGRAQLSYVALAIPTTRQLQITWRGP